MTTKPLGKPELERLAKKLREMRAASAYPPTVQALLAAAEVSADAVELTTKAGKYWRTSAKRPVAPRKSTKPVSAKKKARPKQVVSYADALVFAPEDSAEIAASEELVVHLLDLARTDRTHAHASSTLADFLPSHISKAFSASIRRRLEGSAPMPAAVGRLRIEGHWKLFLLKDMVSGAATPSSGDTADNDTAHGVDRGPFPDVFAEAFDEIDQQTGRRNYVLLHDLRQRLAAIPRPDFDAGLNELRRSQKYSLDSADGRHIRLTPEQIDAGIREAGSVLVYVARR
jgi:hypothetical protein